MRTRPPLPVVDADYIESVVTLATFERGRMYDIHAPGTFDIYAKPVSLLLAEAVLALTASRRDPPSKGYEFLREEYGICAVASPDGWLCIKNAGHEGEHGDEHWYEHLDAEHARGYREGVRNEKAARRCRDEEEDT